MRRSGKTTRLIDDAVQYLFTNKEIQILNRNGIEKKIKNGLNIHSEDLKFVDPNYTYHYRAQMNFTEKLIDRLNSEHEGQFNIKKHEDFIIIEVGINGRNHL